MDEFAMNLVDTAPVTLTLDANQRAEVWRQSIQAIETYLQSLDTLVPAREFSRDEILNYLADLDFSRPSSPDEAIRYVAEGLTEFQVHTSHRRYYGLFNPGSTTMGIAADALAAAFNPQVASWTHSPFATEVEAFLIREIGERFGYQRERIDGTLCSGGAEANHTALICALTSQFPSFSDQGVRSFDKVPLMYVSQQAHHSFVKAARFCGLGTEAVRIVPVGPNSTIDPVALEAMIQADAWAQNRPFFVAATFGTTNAGVLDPIPEIAEIAARHGLWFHVDAAWGGMAALVPELKGLLGGVEQADSITFDAHKKMSVPMGAGMFITRHPEILGEACRITTDYMPAKSEDAVDSYTHSMQWSRRFTGLKILMSLMVAGWDGYAQAIRHQVEMGHQLRLKLAEHEWVVLNNTPLPVACFIDGTKVVPREELKSVSDRIVAAGKGWISTTRLGDGGLVLRACITSYRTDSIDLDELVAALNEVRRDYGA